MPKHNRRKKKLRNPSPEAVADFVKQRQEQAAREQAAREEQRRRDAEARAAAEGWDKLDPAERRRRLDDAYIESLTPEERAEWAEYGRQVHDNLTRTTLVPTGPLTAEEAQGMLDNCARFLNKLVDLAHGVMHTLDPHTVRRIVAADVPLTESMRVALKASGHNVDDLAEKQRLKDVAEDPSPRKRPRGARHPLMALMGLAVQATRLLTRLTREVWPELHNQFTKEEKDERFRARQSTLMQASLNLERLEKLKPGTS
jgi:hypothetical protein